jgi:cysteine desulfurase
LDPRRYFDHAATTPLAPEVREEMRPFLEEAFGNAHSLHSWGRRAMAAVDLARERVAEAIGAEAPEQIVFTSGATEANNWVVQLHPGGAMSPFEHPALREPGELAGFSILANEGTRLLAPDDLPPMVSVMLVNNEVGTVWPFETHPKGGTQHSDATQGLGKVPIRAELVDYLSLSSHKVYGPKGVGALYLRDGYEPAFLRGGEQEGGLRAGTLNVPGIVGFGLAAMLAEERREEDRGHAEEMRMILLQEIQSVADWQVNGLPDEGSALASVPHILSLSFLGLEGETLVLEADAAGFAISAGAACSAGHTEPSHVLEALGLDAAWARGTVRVGFGRGNDADSAASLGKCIAQTVEKLRTIA